MIDNIVIDTGASHLIISSDVVDDLGIVWEKGDQVVTICGVGGRGNKRIVRTK